MPQVHHCVPCLELCFGATSTITFSLSIGGANQGWLWEGFYGCCLTHQVEKVLPGKWRETELPGGLFGISEATRTPGTIQVCEWINYFVLKLVQLGCIYWTNHPPLPNLANFPQDSRYQQLVSISSVRSFFFFFKLCTLLSGGLKTTSFILLPPQAGPGFPSPSLGEPSYQSSPGVCRRQHTLTDWSFLSTDACPWDTAPGGGRTGIPATSSAALQLGAVASLQTGEWWAWRLFQPQVLAKWVEEAAAPSTCAHHRFLSSQFWGGLLESNR